MVSQSVDTLSLQRIVFFSFLFLFFFYNVLSVKVALLGLIIICHMCESDMDNMGN